MNKYSENKSFGWYLTKAARKITRMYNKELQKNNISASQSGILYMLYEAELANDEITQIDLSKTLFLNAVNTHKLVKRLRGKDLVSTRKCTIDKRRSIVTLTQTGKDLIPDIEQADIAVTKQIKKHYEVSKSLELEKKFNTGYNVLKKLIQP